MVIALRQVSCALVTHQMRTVLSYQKRVKSDETDWGKGENWKEQVFRDK